MPKGYAMYWLRKRILKYRWKRIHAAWKRGERLTLPLRVPSVLVTGSLGKTTTCRMVAHILSSSGLYVALSTTQGLFLNGVTRRLGDSATCPYASKLLLDSKVQAAVFELAHAALARDGIAFDGCDVSAVLNVRDNHVGFGGIDSVEDIARIKSQVAQVARRMVVLNADDPFCLAMRDQVRATETCLVNDGCPERRGTRTSRAGRRGSSVPARCGGNPLPARGTCAVRGSGGGDTVDVGRVVPPGSRDGDVRDGACHRSRDRAGRRRRRLAQLRLGRTGQPWAHERPQ